MGRPLPSSPGAIDFRFYVSIYTCDRYRAAVSPPLHTCSFTGLLTFCLRCRVYCRLFAVPCTTYTACHAYTLPCLLYLSRYARSKSVLRLSIHEQGLANKRGKTGAATVAEQAGAVLHHSPATVTASPPLSHGWDCVNISVYLCRHASHNMNSPAGSASHKVHTVHYLVIIAVLVCYGGRHRHRLFCIYRILDVFHYVAWVRTWNYYRFTPCRVSTMEDSTSLPHRRDLPRRTTHEPQCVVATGSFHVPCAFRRPPPTTRSAVAGTPHVRYTAWRNSPPLTHLPTRVHTPHIQPLREDFCPHHGRTTLTCGCPNVV